MEETQWGKNRIGWGRKGNKGTAEDKMLKEMGQGREGRRWGSLFNFSLGSRPAGQGLVRETQLLRMDWSAFPWTGKIVSPHRHNKSLDLGACRQSAQNHIAVSRLCAALFIQLLSRNSARRTAGFICADARIVLIENTTATDLPMLHCCFLDILIYWMAWSWIL